MFSTRQIVRNKPARHLEGGLHFTHRKLRDPACVAYGRGGAGKVHDADRTGRACDTVGDLDTFGVRSPPQTVDVAGKLLQEHFKNITLKVPVPTRLRRQNIQVQRSGRGSVGPIQRFELRLKQASLLSRMGAFDAYTPMRRNFLKKWLTLILG